MQKINDKLYSWASILEDNTREQAELASTMPFIYPHIALMPDAHLGKGATVGSVIPTVGAIMPAAVGVDIGCGMIAVKTQFTEASLDGLNLETLRHSIERSIPLSAGRYNNSLPLSATKRIKELEGMATRDYDEISGNWRMQLGSLGSGNHFIEVSLDEENNVWLFLHSGSRGIGNKIAMMHIKIAQKMTDLNSIADPDLAHLTEGTPEFDRYIADLRWAQHFALLNREEMMDRVISDFAHFMRAIPGPVSDANPLPEIQQLERINCHHNFTQEMEIQGKNVWLSRKGAIDASKGKLGLVPGSMGTASYVVEGLGNEMSFSSSPHGAGRNFSRSKARKTFTMGELEQAMMGIEWSHSRAFLDEIPGAYKDIDVVMEDAKDLVQIKHTLHQVVNVKGD